MARRDPSILIGLLICTKLVAGASVWPAPAQMEIVGEAVLMISNDFVFDSIGEGSVILKDAFSRYASLLDRNDFGADHTAPGANILSRLAGTNEAEQIRVV